MQCEIGKRALMGLVADGIVAATTLEAAQPRDVSRAVKGATMSEEVHAGQEGWLFLVGGSNQALRYYTEPSFLSDDHIRAWVSLLQSRAEAAAQNGARYLHLFAPDKLSVYPEYFTGDLPCFARRPAAAIGQAARDSGLGKHLLDAEPAFGRDKTRAAVYYKTDTHWTYAGLLTAYRVICDALGVTPLAALESRPFVESERALDLGSKLSPPRKERFRQYEILRSARRTEANILVQEAEARRDRPIGGLMSGSQVRYLNESPDAIDARLVLFGDSYSEWRPTGLTAMLAETFREVCFFWSSSFDAGQVARIRPDFVVSELAERFARYVPDDTRDLDAYARDRLALHRAKEAAIP